MDGAFRWTRRGVLWWSKGPLVPLIPGPMSCTLAKFCLRITFHYNWVHLCFSEAVDVWFTLHWALRDRVVHRKQHYYLSAVHFDRSYSVLKLNWNPIFLVAYHQFLFWTKGQHQNDPKALGLHLKCRPKWVDNRIFLPWFDNSSLSSIIDRSRLFLIVYIPVGHFELQMYFKKLYSSFKAATDTFNCVVTSLC